MRMPFRRIGDATSYRSDTPIHTTWNETNAVPECTPCASKKRAKLLSPIRIAYSRVLQRKRADQRFHGVREPIRAALRLGGARDAAVHLGGPVDGFHRGGRSARPAQARRARFWPQDAEVHRKVSKARRSALHCVNSTWNTLKHIGTANFLQPKC